MSLTDYTKTCFKWVSFKVVLTQPKHLAPGNVNFVTFMRQFENTRASTYVALSVHLNAGSFTLKVPANVLTSLNMK